MSIDELDLDKTSGMTKEQLASHLHLMAIITEMRRELMAQRDEIYELNKSISKLIQDIKR